MPCAESPGFLGTILLALTREISEARRGVLTLATDQLDTSKIAERYSGETLHNYSSQVDVTVSTLMLYDLALTGAFSGFTPDDVADLVWLGYRSDKDSKKLFVSEERQTELLEKVLPVSNFLSLKII